MSLKEARRITGGLTRTTKLPGYSYSLDPMCCKRGQVLVEQMSSVCSYCYAMAGWYMVGPAAQAIVRRQESIKKVHWVKAMVRLLEVYAQPPLHWFRWHDAGDLQGVWHLTRIVQVCAQTPWINHWIATREYDMVATWQRLHGPFPRNLMVRLSADFLDKLPELPPELEYSYTSTAHRYRGMPVERDPRDPSLTVECQAFRRGNKCGKCRSCWSFEVQNVSYLVH